MYFNKSVVYYKVQNIFVCQYVYGKFVSNYVPFLLQFSKKSEPSSASESEGGSVSDASNGSSLPIIKNPSSRKTLFKGKGKGLGKCSSRSSSKGDRQMELVEKVRMKPLYKLYHVSGDW